MDLHGSFKGPSVVLQGSLTSAQRVLSKSSQKDLKEPSHKSVANDFTRLYRIGELFSLVSFVVILYLSMYNERVEKSLSKLLGLEIIPRIDTSREQKEIPLFSGTSRAKKHQYMRANKVVANLL